MRDSFRLTSKLLVSSLLLFICLLTAVLWFLGELRYLFFGSYALVPAILFYVISRLLGSEKYPGTNGSEYKCAYLVKLFGVLLTAGLAVLWLEELRTLTFFVLMSAAGMVIYFQIRKFGESHPGLILTEMSIYISILIFSISMNYWYFVGGTDIFVHTSFVRSIMNNGSMPSSTVYEKFPLWHIFVIMVDKITGSSVDLHKVVALTSGLIFSGVPILVYSLAKKLSQSVRISQYAALFSVVNTTVIYYGAYSIARSIVLVLLLSLLYQLFSSNELRNILLFSILSLATIIFHPSSPPFILPVLALVCTVLLIYHRQPASKLKKRLVILSAVFSLIVITYWTFSAVSISQAIAGTIAHTTRGGGPETITSFGTGLTAPSLSDLYQYLPYSLLIGLVLFSVRYTLRDEQRSSIHKSAILISVVLAAIAFPNPLKTLDAFEKLNFDRWEIYTQFFTSLAAATGLSELIRRVRKPAAHLSILLLVGLLIFTSLTNPLIAADNPDFSGGAVTPYLSQGEGVAIDHAVKVAPGFIMSDYTVTRYLDANTKKSHILIVDPDTYEIVSGDSGQYILLRDEELAQRGLKVYPSKDYSHRPWYGRVARADVIAPPSKTAHKVYQGDNTTGYVTT
ncbi:hypothetical protein [Haloferax mucosum]|uniref:hypothetical protein n=1 Tax=Haloferax mucosum TaxID=403181 RepID=UPI0012674630|nr:hypothetical protein [Haloferax mucosum]